MANKARGEIDHKIGNKNYQFAVTLAAAAMLDDMGDGQDVEKLTAALSEMTRGTANPLTAAQIKATPITIPDIMTIIKNATEAASNAMPEGRELGNRKARRAQPAKKKPRKR